MTNLYFTDSDPDFWPCQQPINEQNALPNNSYQAPQQQVYPNPNYNQAANQSCPPCPSLLETLLRHGRDAVGQDYVQLGVRPEMLPAGHHMSNISSQSPPYTPTSSIESISPVGFLPDSRGQVQRPEIQNGYLQNYQAYPTQQLPNSYVSPPMMPTNSPTSYGVQQSYANYVDSYNKERSSTGTNEFVNGQAQQQMNYPWMKSYSKGL